MMFKTLYSARKESKVVKEAAPAINGKTKGTKVAESVGPSYLKISTTKIISHHNTNITKAPATAKEEISTLNKESKELPTNKKDTRITNEKTAA